MFEAARVAQWLVTTLAGAAPGGVWEGVAPLNTPTPYIVFQAQGGPGDISVIGGIRVWTDTTWQVKAVGPSSDTAALVTVADTIDSRLQRASGTAGSDGRILFSVRQRAMTLPELVNGVQWLNLIQFYDILAQPLS